MEVRRRQAFVGGAPEPLRRAPRVRPAERLVAVDGRGVAGMSGERVDLLLRGPVGESHCVRTDLRGADVRVEDLIPLP